MNSQNQKELEKELEIDLQSEFYKDGVLEVEAGKEICKFNVSYSPKSGYVTVDGYFTTKDGKAGSSIAVAHFNVYQFTDRDKDLYEDGKKFGQEWWPVGYPARWSKGEVCYVVLLKVPVRPEEGKFKLKIKAWS